VKLQIREKMCFDDINNDVGGEWGLAVEAAKVIIRHYLNDEAAERYCDGDERVIIGMFKWNEYLIARGWLTNHKALSCFIRLRYGFKPWELKKQPKSQ